MSTPVPDARTQPSLDELRTFAQSLGPGCSAISKENCSAEQRAELEEVMKMPPADIEAVLLRLLPPRPSLRKGDRRGEVRRLGDPPLPLPPLRQPPPRGSVVMTA